MPNLVGIGNSQVPTNSMLGGLAYQDSVGEIDIDKIKAQTGDTAVDIFVYDTSKDSDGGAWRYRTRNKSWYNEGASQKRGSRKEFPAVAVIVAKAREVTIYDGDDPNLSMWMIFDAGEETNHGAALQFWGVSTAGTVSSVFMLNGQMVVGTDNGSSNGIYVGMSKVDFLNDSMEYRRNFSNQYVKHVLPISERNEIQYTGTVLAGGLVGGDVADVAMTVLPNAPIDASTGLPVPTIAVATDGGVSVIKNDGTVVSKTTSQLTSGTNHSTYFHKNIDISGENAVVNYEYTYTGGYAKLMVVTLNDLTVLRRYGRGYSNTSSHPYFNAGTIHRHFPKQIYKNNQIFTREQSNDSDPAGSSNGMLTIFEDQTSPSNGLINRISSSYNTGWMHGDIKGAFLSDIDTTNLSGGNKVSNGSDWSGASGSQSSTPPSGWLGGNGATFKIETGNGAIGNYIRLYNENNGGAGPNSYMYTAITTVVGKKYKISLTQIHRATIQVYVRVGNSINASNFSDASTSFTSSSSSTPKRLFGTFTATATTTYVTLGIISGSHNYSVGWDDVVVTETDDDRGVKDNINYRYNGLHAYGTINKNPVATGAELVAYSNFSNSRYLFQPYNSDLDFTNTMSIMFWVKDWVGSDSLIHRGPGTTRNSKTSFHLYCTYDYNYRLTLTTDGSSEITYEIPLTANQTGWQHLCFTLSGGTVKGYLNGMEKTLSRTSFSGNIFSQATDKNGLWIGTGPVGGAAETASLALLRLSASAPSAEQVKKMYNDEKCLYHENAKCTLHGTSDDVKALAFDDTNDILHVGTSAGRSEFQGLNRINNTTTAVTTAISASNEFVAEQ